MNIPFQGTIDLPIYERPNEVWMAEGRSDGPPRRGTWSDPHLVADANGFDRIFRSHYQRPTCFRLHPGTYFTRGPWAFPGQNYVHFGGGSSLLGSGSAVTRLVLTDPVLETNGTPRPDTSVMWIGKPYGTDCNLRVEGITLHANAGTLGSLVYPDGIRIFGSEVVLRDVVVTGLRGRYPDPANPNDPGFEAFGFLLNNVPVAGSSDGGALIEDCAVRDCVPGTYVNAFSVGYVGSPPDLRRSLVQRCHAQLGRDNHAAFTVCRSTTVRDCTASGVRNGIYNDTGEVEGLLVDGCDIQTHYAAVYFVGMQAIAPKRNARIINSAFNYQPITNLPGIGVALIDQAGAAFENVVVEGCTFQTPPNHPFALVLKQAR